MVPKPQSFLVDAEGNRVGVVLDIREYQALIDDLEELEAVRAPMTLPKPAARRRFHSSRRSKKSRAIGGDLSPFYR
jgi:hypothetical protein